MLKAIATEIPNHLSKSASDLAHCTLFFWEQKPSLESKVNFLWYAIQKRAYHTNIFCANSVTME